MFPVDRAAQVHNLGGIIERKTLENGGNEE